MTTRTDSRFKLSAAGNVSRRSQGSISRDPGGSAVVRSTISFTAGATISDSGSGFGAFRAGDPIEVRGSTLNSRRFVVATATPGVLTVVPAVIQTAAAGPAITISRL